MKLKINKFHKNNSNIINIGINYGKNIWIIKLLNVTFNVK
jgi:hypothetical protein